MRARLAAFVGLTLMGSAALAAQHQVPTKVLLVKNPPSGARKVLWKVKETGSAATVAGDPTADGATLRVQLTTGGDQCVSMPSSGWSAVGSLGFKYKDAALANGPVKVALIKKPASGTLLIKALLKNGGPTSISVAPGDPTTSYATNFTLGTGDDYCGGTASATPDTNDATTFKVANDGAPAGCIAPCSVATVSCSNPATPNGTPCDDGIACTDDEFCLNGVCGNGAPNCTPEPCTREACDPESGECVATPYSCPVIADEVQRLCWDRFCDPTVTACQSEFNFFNSSCIPSECALHADCDDGDLCTLDQCLGTAEHASCAWTPEQCDDSVECTVDSCFDKNTGCEHRVENPTTFCDDGDACTADDYADYPASCDCVHSPICP